jgi:hypothetical protein
MKHKPRGKVGTCSGIHTVTRLEGQALGGSLRCRKGDQCTEHKEESCFVHWFFVSTCENDMVALGCTIQLFKLGIGT